MEKSLPRKNDIERMQIERRLAHLYNDALHHDLDRRFYSKEFQEYLNCWHTLVRYYNNYDDPLIGIIVIDLYDVSIEILEEMAKVTSEIAILSDIGKAIKDLEYSMERIMREGRFAFSTFYWEE